MCPHTPLSLIHICDFVTVRLTVPVKETAVTDAEAEARRKAEAERLETCLLYTSRCV